jgi:REP element-mobilizing transposase RayT
MPQSLSKVFIHVVFSTKDREPWLNKALQPGLHAYLATVVRDMNAEAFRVGGTFDHVHVAATLPRTLTQADIVKRLKTASTHWLKRQHRNLAGFAWQRGYGIFSVGKSQVAALVNYIATQEEHHRARSFQDEYRSLLKRYDVEYEEKYVWD